VTVIEVYADIWCPFAHVGLRAVVRRRKQLGRDDVVLRARAWPLELVNGAPLDPATTTSHVEDLRAQVATDLFRHFDPAEFPTTTLPALGVAAAAYRRDDATGEAVSLALRDALFEEGHDISRPDVLAAVTSAHGVDGADPADNAAVLADWSEGQQRGVKGSPHFFCGGLESFCPSLEISRDEQGHLVLGRNIDRLDAFLAGCFKI
jgi:predicted DsbA family dithiol-disulfide isomerase